MHILFVYSRHKHKCSRKIITRAEDICSRQITWLFQHEST